MASARRNYQNMDDILDFITNDDDESDDDIALEDEESDIDSDWEYEEEPPVVFIPENHVHEAETEIEDVIEVPENQAIPEALPDVPPEQEDAFSTDEEENRLSEDRTNTDIENGSSSEEDTLTNLARRGRVGRAPPRLRGAPVPDSSRTSENTGSCCC